MSRFADVIVRLSETIEARKTASPDSSYTAKLLSEGVERAAKKLGEEAVEVVIAAVQKDKDGLASESADLIYHFLVTLAAAGVSLDDVAGWLESREGRSGLEEKAWRGESQR
ncbi:phosphoribosyl-ATP diphosphatase [Phenylobacterium aquaticum]|uniref:phosphoribosyl-ATP diphosphatase n=1 Tax=Phenylobacterium aquaticum TaxID=1763816 RepID=UPI0026EC4BAC|nr:phosphoribosyl-ATP diphosphatase [Phenylobacterium aquaticum]